MAEESPEIMNLDLNLDPAPETRIELVSNEGVNSNEFIDSRPFNRVREAVRRRRHQRILRITAETENLNMESNPSMSNLGNSNTLEAGEGSVVAAEETTIDVSKACKNINGVLEFEGYIKKDHVEKGVSNVGSSFDCNICLDQSREPVVTCCGHLFCWSCLYRWLNVHSDSKECPVCKGEVSDKTVTPIYGQGKVTYVPEDDSDLKIPPRPTASRVDSWRQTMQRIAFNLPVDEMIPVLGNRFHSTRDPNPSDLANAARERETAERARSVLNRFWISRDLLREQSIVASSIDDVGSTSRDAMSSRGFLERQPQLRRSTSSSLTSAERIVEAYFRSEMVGGRNQEQEQPLRVDDGDSFSSIAAAINSDNAIEMDSGVSLSASSSRRRTDASRDVDPPPIRRRRLH